MKLSESSSSGIEVAGWARTEPLAWRLRSDL